MSSKGEVEIVEPTPAERALARWVAEARATVPIELGVVVEMSAALSLASETRVSITSVVLRACALALAEHPRANAAYRDGRFELYSSVNIALALEHSSPVIFDAADLSLAELSAEVSQLSQRAERGELRPPELPSRCSHVCRSGSGRGDRPPVDRDHSARRGPSRPERSEPSRRCAMELSCPGTKWCWRSRPTTGS